MSTLPQITPDLIKRYQDDISKDLSASTVRRRSISIRKFIAWAKDQGLIEVEPPQKRITDKPAGKNVGLPGGLRGNPRFSRWYKRYQNIPGVSYLNIVVLIILSSALGFGIYNQFFKNAKAPSAAPLTALNRPNRYLSFQGRLTLTSGTPVIAPTNLAFNLYSASSGGSPLWSSGACSITPDSDGVFSTLLGSSCGTELTSDIFSQNAGVWLGVTVAGDAEATPRVQIATVAYALNAETLQGYPASSSATINTVPVINNSGQIVIAASSPKIQSTSGNFAIEGQSITIDTPSGSFGNINFYPDSTGSANFIFNGASPGSGTGMLTATDANLTSGALIYGSVASNASGYNLLQLRSGSPLLDRFVVDSVGNASMSGNLTLAGGTRSIQTTLVSPLTIGGSTTGNIVLSPSNNVAGGNVSPSVTNVTDLGTSSSLEFRNIYAQAFSQSGHTLCDSTGTGCPAGITNYWQLTTNSLAPANTTYALNVGNTASSSAYFHVPGTNNNDAWFNLGTGNVGIGTTGPTRNLDVNGNIGIKTFTLADVGTGVIRLGGTTATNQIQAYDGTNNYILEIFNGTTNAINLNSNGNSWLNGGNVGIGTTNPTEKLEVKGWINTSNPGVDSGIRFESIGSAGTGGTIYRSAANAHLIIQAQTASAYYPLELQPLGGNVGIGTTAPTAVLDVAGAASVSGTLAFRTGTGTIQTTTQSSLVLGGTTTGNIILSPSNDVAGGFIAPNVTNVTDLGTSSKLFRNIYGTTLHQGANTVCDSSNNCSFALGTNYWQLTTNSLSPTNSTYAFNIGNTASSSAYFHVPGTNNNDAWFNLGTGNVGIGVTNPSAKLSVQNNVAQTSGVTPYGIGVDLTFTNGQTNTYPQNYLATNFNGTNTQSSLWAALFYARNNNTGTVTSAIGADGQVQNNNASGVISYGTALQADTPITTGAITNSYGVSIANMATASVTNAYGLYIANQTGASTLNYSLYSAGGTNYFAGNVGIGTTNPSSLLSINGTGTLGSTYQQYITNGTQYLKFGANATAAEIQSAGSVPLYLNYGGNNTIINPSSGSVGIETTVPYGQLDIGGNDITKLRFSRSSDNNAFAFYHDVTNSKLDLQYRTANNATIYTQIMSFDYAGNVGIGTTAPTAVLDVAGAASVSGTLAFRTGTGTIQTTTQSSLVLGGTTTGNIILSPSNDVAGGFIAPNVTNVTDLGTSSKLFRNIYGTNIFQGVNQVCDSGGNHCPASSGVNFWQLGNNILAPVNVTNDLTIGGNATNSAFQVFGATNAAGDVVHINSTVVAAGDVSEATSSALTTGDIFHLSQAGTTAFSGNAINLDVNNFGGGTFTGNFLRFGRNGSTVYTLDNAANASQSGTLTFGGTATIQSTATRTLTLGGTTTGNIVISALNDVAAGYVAPNVTNVTDLGTSTKLFRNIYGSNIFQGVNQVCDAGGNHCPTFTGVNFWQLGNNILAPVNVTNDLTIGGNATASAKFQVFGAENTTSGLEKLTSTVTSTGSILSATSSAITSGNVISLGQGGTTAFSGNGLLMDFNSYGGGTFTGNYLKLNNNGVTQFKIGATGILTFAQGDTLTNGSAGTITLTPGSGTTETLVTATATTLNLFNTVATTISLGGAATTALNIGNGNTAYTAINLGSGTGGNTINIGNGANTANTTVNILGGIATAGTQTLNLGTGASAKTVNIGNGTLASAINVTSGTGSQTHTSSVANTSGLSGAFVFKDTALSSGDFIYATASAITSGNMVNLGQSGTSAFSGNGILMDFNSYGGGAFTGKYLKFNNNGLTQYSVDATGNASESGTLTIGSGSVIRPAYGALNLAYKSGADTWTNDLTIKDNTGDIDLAGGSGSTGCTVFNSTGNLTCSGTITGTIAGTIPWSSLTAPTTTLGLTMPAGDETTFTVQSTSQSGFTWTSSTLNTGNMINATESAITSGNIIKLGQGGTTAFSGTGLVMDFNSYGGGAFTGNYLKLNNNGITQFLVGPTGAIDIGSGVTQTTYNRFTNTNITSTHSLNSAQDVLIGGKAEINGTLYLNADIASTNGISTISFPSDPTALGNTNILTNGTWKIENPAAGGNPGLAALIVNQQKLTQDIFTASASGVTKFTIANNGNLTATGTLTGLTGLSSSGTINFSGLSASLGVYTDGSKNLTSTVPTSGQLGYWTRTGTNLYNTNQGDNVGIGITNPATTLGVVGTASVSGQFVAMGNVGVGTTSPAIWHMSGGRRALTIQGVADAGFLELSNGANLASGISAGQIDFLNAATTVSPYAAIQAKTSGSGGANDFGGYLAFLTKGDNAATLTEAMRIDSSGNVGIGTTAPTALLNVGGTITSSLNNAQALLVNPTFNGTGDGFQGTTSQPIFTPPASTTYTTSYGLLGIAKADLPNASSAITSLYGIFGRTDTTNNNTGTLTNAFDFLASAPSLGTLKPTSQYGVYIQNQGASGITTSTGLYVAAQSGSTNNYAAVFAGGYVGIGTTAPLTQLDVSQTLAGSTLQARVFNTDNTNAASNALLMVRSGGASGGDPLLGLSINGVYTWTVGVDNTNNYFKIAGGGNVGVGTTNDRFTIDTSGNVGIGTTSPGAVLDVAGGAHFQVGGTGGTLSIGTPTGESGITINGTNRADIRFNNSRLFLGAGTGTGVPTLGIGIDTTGGVSVPNGSAANPEIAFTGSSTSGFYGLSPNLGFTVSGGIVMQMGTTNITSYNHIIPNASATLNLGATGTRWGCLWYNNSSLGTCASDARLKTNIQPLDYGDALGKIAKLIPSTFTFRNDPDNQLTYGLIAQQVLPIAPELVSMGSDGFYQLDYGQIGWLVFKGVQQAQGEIQNLQNDLSLTYTGDLNIAPDSTGNYNVTNTTTNTVVSRMAALAKLVVANVEAGAIATTDLATNSLTAFQGTIDHLLVTSGLVAANIQTKLISPLPGNTDVTVQIGSNTQPGKFAIQNAQNQEVASIDNQGNATFSGVVHSQNIDAIQALLNQVSTDQSVLLAATSGANLTATGSASIAQLITSDLYVTNQAAINSLSVSNTLTVGPDMIIGSGGNTINSLSAPLRIQSLAMAPVEIMNGLVTIDTHGNVIIGGDLAVAGRIHSSGLTLKDSQQTTDYGQETATDSASLLSLQNQSGTQVAGVNSSGSASFNDLTTGGLTIASDNSASSSSVVNGILTTNSTVGSATIPAGTSEITIKNPKVTDYTLVYVTPTSDTQNNVLYVKSKQAGQFVVGFVTAINSDVNFNWWVVQVQN